MELIQELIESKGEARATDLADRLGISKVAVSKTIQRLAKEGLVDSQPYRSIFLTLEGQLLAKEAKERHVAVVEFLLALGVSTENAEIDAEGIEHHVSDETLTKMREFVARNS